MIRQNNIEQYDNDNNNIVNQDYNKISIIITMTK